MRDYITVEKGLRAIGDGGTPYSDDDCLWVPPRVTVLGADTLHNQRIALKYGRIVNRTGGPLFGGFAARIAMWRWNVATMSGAGVLADITPAAQNSTSDDVAVETTAANSGLLVAAADLFNLLLLRITTASVGAGVVRVIQYPTGTSTWTTIVNPIINVPQGVWAVGVQPIWWLPPTNMVPLASGHLDANTTHLIGKFGIRLQSTTPPTTAALAGSLSVLQAKQGHLAIADDTAFEVRGTDQSDLFFDCGADALVAVLSGAAAMQSSALAQFRPVG